MLDQSIMSLLHLPHRTFTSPSPSDHRHTLAGAALSRRRSFSVNGDSSLFLRSQIKFRRFVHRIGTIRAMADPLLKKMNLNEYMVTLDKPLGIRFALSVDGRVFVHSMKKGGNAEKSRIIMVGDKLRKVSDSSSGSFIEIKDLSDTEKMIKESSGSCSLVLERPFSPYPLHELHLNGNGNGDQNILFNKGRVPLATWNNKSNLSSDLSASDQGSGNSGFAIFAPRFLSSQGWDLLSKENNNNSNNNVNNIGTNNVAKYRNEIVGIFTEEEGENIEWSYGVFPLEEYIKALERGKGELHYNHSQGMQYSKITEQIYVGSCIQTERDVETLSHDLGITAVLNFQSESECANWGINSETINNSCQQNNILMVSYPIREYDMADLRKKLPFCVGLLLRLLRKNYKIFVTCTSGFERSPSCVIAYLHWIQDTPLNAAYNFVTGPHSCKPDRAAIVWATWDLIALMENGRREGPPTHSVTFFWNGHEGEEVCLVGDFTSNWKDSIRAVHKGGPRYEVDLRLRHGKYHYKFIVGGQWKHSTSLPVETDERGNKNNVIRVGDIARIRPAPSQLHIKDATVVKVIERPLTEDERFLLAFAARRMAFAISPLTLSPK